MHFPEPDALDEDAVEREVHGHQRSELRVRQDGGRRAQGGSFRDRPASVAKDRRGLGGGAPGDIAPLFADVRTLRTEPNGHVPRLRSGGGDGAGHLYALRRRHNLRDVRTTRRLARQGKVEFCAAAADGAAAGGRASRVVELCGNGAIADEHHVAIVRPESNHLAGPDEVGEIWLSGPSVGCGYWGNEVSSAGTFHALLDPPDGRRYLRTGDLGFLIGDELFVAGRMKDMIIVRGRNIYPSDIEELVERLDERILASAAFEVPDRSGEGAVGIVIELRRNARGRPDDLLQEIKPAKSRPASTSRSAPRSPSVNMRCRARTSGKIQRNRCRSQYLAGEIVCLTASAQGETAESV